MAGDDNSFGKVFEEFNKAVEAAQNETKQTGVPVAVDVGAITRKYIEELFQETKRPVLIYVVDFFNSQKAAIAGNEVSIILSDKDGIVEATRALPAGPLDVILHSPGGSLEATESIVDILRRKFTDIRFFIPSTAKSAATMLALSGDEIYLASSAELGPIDPQVLLRREGMGVNQSAAQAIIDQFEAAQKDLAANPNKLPAWLPILPMYGPSLYQDCKNSIKLSKDIVRTWLVKYMFKTLPKKRERVNRARRVVNYFANHQRLKSHGRKIGLAEIEQNLSGLLTVKNLDDNPVLCSKVMGIYYCFLQVFQRGPAIKIIQNSAGQFYIRQVQMPQPLQFLPPAPHS